MCVCVFVTMCVCSMCVQEQEKNDDAEKKKDGERRENRLLASVNELASHSTSLMLSTYAKM